MSTTAAAGSNYMVEQRIRFLTLSPEQSGFYEDQRGFGLFLVQALADLDLEVDPRSFHVVKTEPGRVRGNHLHPTKHEILFLFGGPNELIWQEPGGPVQRKMITDEKTLIVVPPGVAHAVVNPGPSVTYLAAWNSPGDPEESADRRPVELA